MKTPKKFTNQITCFDCTIKKSKKLPDINQDQALHKIPSSWKWIRLEEISDIGTGSTPLKSNPDYYDNGTIPWVTSAATSLNSIYKTDNFITSQAISDYRLRIYPSGSLIVALYVH